MCVCEVSGGGIQVMGGVWSEGVQPLPTPAPARLVAGPSNEATPLTNRRKRGLSDVDIEELSPKRKCIRSTSNYIYRTLFQDGADSDITIHALGTYNANSDITIHALGTYNNVYALYCIA